MSTEELARALAAVQKRIEAAALAAGRPPDAVRLVAVSKTVGEDRVRAAYEAGQRAFGENKVQELKRKAGCLPPDCEWHLIGHLQRNKVRDAVRAATWVHSVDSVALLQRIERIADEEGRRPKILIQANISAEMSKHGLSTGGIRDVVEEALACEHLECRGLMTMAPYGAAEEDLRSIFGALRQLRDACVAELGQPLPELSMGMSGDYEIAIAEGATLVRIGTAVFGARAV